MKITRVSQVSGKERALDLNVTEKQMSRFEKGEESIQVIFPMLSADEREFILTGTTPKEWDSIFPEDEESSSEEPAF